ncbi:HutD/Ves family protein [Streptomyces sp. H39-S7]|uniref:HutD/Ves family protein n=1 Tax=Streptomyces sp. H39-S7 TaxID=3004357 RepID=UPI0022B021DE|nr:HutD family protein [Streptomyces sp. H39-S7]MCZ4124457.1 HutD family protein [Streptomyces sp. H39-S7]
MEARILRADDRVPTSWSNGGGVTRELTADPPGAGLADFGWRVSLADVAGDGPYSALPGVDRIITVVDGAGMVLTIDGDAHPPIRPLRPFAFPGDVATGCRLTGGPVVNLNVMTRRGRAAAMVGVVDGTHTAKVPENRSVLLVALADDVEFSVGPDPGPDPDPDPDPGRTVVAGPGDSRLSRFDAVLVSGTDTDAATLRSVGRAAVITVSPAGDAQ